MSRAALSNSNTCSFTILSLEVLKTVFDFDGISPGQNGASIGMVIGRSIEAEREMGLEIGTQRPVRNRSDQGACSKKEPGNAWDALCCEYIFVLVSMRSSF